MSDRDQAGKEIQNELDLGLAGEELPEHEKQRLIIFEGYKQLAREVELLGGIAQNYIPELAHKDLEEWFDRYKVCRDGLESIFPATLQILKVEGQVNDRHD